MTITATLAGAIGMLAQFGFLFGGRSEDGRRNPFGPIGALLLMIVGPIAAMLVQMAISRSREYEADRLGAEICGDPRWLANGLQKLEHYKQGLVNHDRRGASGQRPYVHHQPALGPAAWTACSPPTRRPRNASAGCWRWRRRRRNAAAGARRRPAPIRRARPGAAGGATPGVDGSRGAQPIRKAIAANGRRPSMIRIASLAFVACPRARHRAAGRGAGCGGGAARLQPVPRLPQHRGRREQRRRPQPARHRRPQGRRDRGLPLFGQPEGEGRGRPGLGRGDAARLHHQPEGGAAGGVDVLSGAEERAAAERPAGLPEDAGLARLGRERYSLPKPHLRLFVGGTAARQTPLKDMEDRGRIPSPRPSTASASAAWWCSRRSRLPDFRPSQPASTYFASSGQGRYLGRPSPSCSTFSTQSRCPGRRSRTVPAAPSGGWRRASCPRRSTARRRRLPSARRSPRSAWGRGCG